MNIISITVKSLKVLETADGILLQLTAPEGQGECTCDGDDDDLVTSFCVRVLLHLVDNAGGGTLTKATLKSLASDALTIIHRLGFRKTLRTGLLL